MDPTFLYQCSLALLIYMSIISKSLEDLLTSTNKNRLVLINGPIKAKATNLVYLGLINGLIPIYRVYNLYLYPIIPLFSSLTDFLLLNSFALKICVNFCCSEWIKGQCRKTGLLGEVGYLSPFLIIWRVDFQGYLRLGQRNRSPGSFDYQEQ